MISCILALYLAVPGPPAPRAPRPAALLQDAAAAKGDPDALYAGREDLAQARRAESIWETRLRADAADFESAWKLARARYWLGKRAAEAERKRTLEAGVAAARQAAAMRPGRPEGHFWMADNMGALAESFGLRQGLRYRGAIRDALVRVLAIDPAFQHGSGDRALGRWYFKVPALFGGSRRKAEEHLRRSLTYNPQSTASRFFLAELLLDAGRREEGRAELERVLDAPLDPEWAPEDREFKAAARALLDGLPRPPR
jgi:hypothetical protein